MKKSLKTALIVICVLLVIGIIIGGFFIWRHKTMYIGADAALKCATDDAGVRSSEIFDVDVEFETKRGQSLYEVEFETAEAEFDYIIDARTGEVLSAKAAPEHAE